MTEKGNLAGNTTLLLLKLIENRDMYGYEMIEELRRRSDDTFRLKAGTLYPILHGLEESGAVTSYDAEENGRLRKFYRLTDAGKRLLAEREQAWRQFSGAVELVLKGGVSHAVWN